ncbi:helix-turn-helix domain-containing protein [Alloscardovia macacae]|uniref:Transcriptional regulator, XRE family n=1 Tax=Alloscardovia macacae TaxID=1160091 RepID=A0A261F6K4_9BIFI|nr:transcriptional regulator, XRE family [Alloscardovia macacae]
MNRLITGKLVSLLHEKNMSQKDLSDKTGITPAAISRYANGERAPRPIMLAKIAKALDTSPEDLTGFAQEREIDNAVTLIARNKNNLSDAQRESLIQAILSKD